jgi:uncharacterized UBP type Zn finger protein
MSRTIVPASGAMHERCPHLAATHPVAPRSGICRECVDIGQNWVELWLCLTCGWVACSDDSSGQHARAHYEETDHAVAAPLHGPPGIRWCYAEERSV